MDGLEVLVKLKKDPNENWQRRRGDYNQRTVLELVMLKGEQSGVTTL